MLQPRSVGNGGMRMLMGTSSPWHVGLCRRSAVVVLGVREARTARAVERLHAATPEVLAPGCRAILSGDRSPPIITAASALAFVIVHRQKVLHTLAATRARGPAVMVQVTCLVVRSGLVSVPNYQGAILPVRFRVGWERCGSAQSMGRIF